MSNEHCVDPNANIVNDFGGPAEWEPEETLTSKAFDLGLVYGEAEVIDKLPSEEVAPFWLRDKEDSFSKEDLALDKEWDKRNRWLWYLSSHPKDEASMYKYKAFIAEAQQKDDELCLLKDKVDIDLTPPLPPLHRREELSEGEALLVYLDMYVNTLTYGKLAVAFDVIEDMHKRDLISWYHYVVCGVAVSFRLQQYCPTRYRMGQDYSWRMRGGGWDRVCARLRKHLHTHHNIVKAPSSEDRFNGDVNFHMEDAIDFMSKVRTLAKNNQVDPEEMYYRILRDKDEGIEW